MSKATQRRFTFRFGLKSFFVFSAVASLALWWWLAPRQPTNVETFAGGVRLAAGIRIAKSPFDESETYEQRHGSAELRNVRDRLLARGKYLAGSPNGQWIWYDDDGRKQLAGEFHRGARIGRWTGWHENGRRAVVVEYGEPSRYGGPSEVEIWYSVRDGKTEAWWDNGQRRYVGQYRDDLASGPWQFFDRAGQLAASGSFHRGLAHGDWREYDGSPSPSREIFYWLGHPSTSAAALLDQADADLASPRYADQLRAIDTLALLGPDGAARIAAALESLDADLRRLAFTRLREMGGDAARTRPHLQRWAQSDEPTSRLDAMLALYTIFPAERDDLLRRMLRCAAEARGSERRARTARIASLGRELLSRLDNAISESELRVQRTAIEMLATTAIFRDEVDPYFVDDWSMDVAQFIETHRDHWPAQVQQDAARLFTEIQDNVWNPGVPTYW